MRVRHLLSDVSWVLQVAAGLLFAAISARFAWSSIQLARTAFSGSDAAARHDREQWGEDQSASPSPEGTEVGVPSDQVPEEPPEMLTHQVLVDFGPNRSEVYLNGRHVGKTPYAGQINCKRGDEVRIEVVPPEGMPERRTAICRGIASGTGGSLNVGRTVKEDLPGMDLVEERLRSAERAVDATKHPGLP